MSDRLKIDRGDDANARITSDEQQYMQEQLAKGVEEAHQELSQYKTEIMVERRDANFVFLKDKTKQMETALAEGGDQKAINALDEYKKRFGMTEYTTIGRARVRSYQIALYQALLFAKADDATKEILGNTGPCGCGVDGIYGLQTLLTSAQVLKDKDSSGFHGVLNNETFNYLLTGTTVEAPPEPAQLDASGGTLESGSGATFESIKSELMTLIGSGTLTVDAVNKDMLIAVAGNKDNKKTLESEGLFDSAQAYKIENGLNMKGYYLLKIADTWYRYDNIEPIIDPSKAAYYPVNILTGEIITLEKDNEEAPVPIGTPILVDGTSDVKITKNPDGTFMYNGVTVDFDENDQATLNINGDSIIIQKEEDFDQSISFSVVEPIADLEEEFIPKVHDVIVGDGSISIEENEDGEYTYAGKIIDIDKGLEVDGITYTLTVNGAGEISAEKQPEPVITTEPGTVERTNVLNEVATLKQSAEAFVTTGNNLKDTDLSEAVAEYNKAIELYTQAIQKIEEHNKTYPQNTIETLEVADLKNDLQQHIQRYKEQLNLQTQQLQLEQEAQIARREKLSEYKKQISDEGLDVVIDNTITAENVTDGHLSGIERSINEAKQAKQEHESREAEKQKHADRAERASDEQFDGLVSYDPTNEVFVMSDLDVSIAAASVSNKGELLSAVKEEVAVRMEQITSSLTGVLEAVNTTNQTSSGLVSEWTAKVDIAAFDAGVAKNKTYNVDALTGQVVLLEKGNSILNQSDLTELIAGARETLATYRKTQGEIVTIQKNIEEKAVKIAGQSGVVYRDGVFLLDGHEAPRAEVLQSGYTFTNTAGTEYVVLRTDTPDRGTFSAKEKPKKLTVPDGREQKGEIGDMQVLRSSEAGLSPQEHYLQKDMTRLLVGEYVVNNGVVFKYEQSGAYVELGAEEVKRWNGNVPSSFSEVNPNGNKTLLTLTNPLFSVLGDYATIPANEIVVGSYPTINAGFLQKAVAQRVLAVMSYYVTNGTIPGAQKDAITSYFKDYESFIGSNHPVVQAFTSLETD